MLLIYLVSAASVLAGVVSQHDFLLVARRIGNSQTIDHGIFRVWLHNHTWEKLPVITSGSPYDVAYDPVTELVMWSDGGGQYGIYAAKMDGTGKRLLVESEDARGMIVDVRQGVVYYTNCCSNRSIEAYNIDTATRRPLLNWNSSMNHPHSLALDPSSNILYASDFTLNVIWKMNIDGTGLEEFLSSNLSNPTGLALSNSGDLLYICSTSGEYSEVWTQNATIRSMKVSRKKPCRDLATNGTHIFITDVRTEAVSVMPISNFDPAIATPIPAEPSGGFSFGIHYEHYSATSVSRSTIYPTTPATTSSTAAPTPAPGGGPVGTTTPDDGGGISKDLLTGIASVIAASAVLIVGIGVTIYFCRRNANGKKNPLEPQKTTERRARVPNMPQVPDNAARLSSTSSTATTHGQAVVPDMPQAGGNPARLPSTSSNATVNSQAPLVPPTRPLPRTPPVETEDHIGYDYIVQPSPGAFDGMGDRTSSGSYLPMTSPYATRMPHASTRAGAEESGDLPSGHRQTFVENPGKLNRDPIVYMDLVRNSSVKMLASEDQQ